MAKEKQKPLTREDVLKKMERNGGKAEGLDLSGVEFEDEVDLSQLNLDEIILNKTLLLGANLRETSLAKAELQGAVLYQADLGGANLHLADLRDADLTLTNLNGAILAAADLQGANLSISNLQAAELFAAIISPATNFERAYWGDYKVCNEGFPGSADTYRELKVWHTSAGMYDIAGEFFFREMTAKRKALKWWPNPLPRAWSKFLSIICGYGEKWHRVIISAAVVVCGLGLIYFAIGTLTPNTLLNCLYYSAVSFTALGYGQWAPEPTGWVRALGAAQAFIGVFMMALFLITFIRKMTR